MQLPLLEYVQSKNKSVDLSEYSLIACQHLLGTTIDMIDVLVNQGMKVSNIWIIGKCYSSNREVFDLLIHKGINVSADSFSFDSKQTYDKQFQAYILHFLKEALNSLSTKKIIILDDGGFLIDAFQSENSNVYNSITSIEQTTSGFDRLNGKSIPFPIVNIARSAAKLDIEAPIIAEKVVEQILSTFDSYYLTNPNVLVVGNGAIGTHIAKQLRSKNFSVSVCDILQNLCDFDGDYKKELHTFDVIIGATGKTIISSDDLSTLKENVLLMSASSSDREFDSVYIRAGQNIKNCHDNIERNGIRLINCGFPINFKNGAKHCVEPEKIQLTRALLLAGVFQSIHEEKNGMVALNSEIQKELLKQFKMQL